MNIYYQRGKILEILGKSKDASPCWCSMWPCYQIMGCGRSKPSSTNDNANDNEQESKSKKAKTSKHDKVADRKENIDPNKVESKNGQHTNKEIVPKKQDVETGKLKSRRPTPAVNSNGTMQDQTIHSELHVSVKQDRIDAHYTSNYKDKHYPGPNKNQNSNIRMTNSQLEFFKMLDEKIERGQDYTSEDELSQTIDIQSTSSRIDYTQENIPE